MFFFTVFTIRLIKYCFILLSQVTYFRFSRGIMVETMDERHIKATAHLKEARTFGSKMLEKSEGDAPPLTPKQKEQLQQYLRLMKEGEPDVYPLESKRWE